MSVEGVKKHLKRNKKFYIGAVSGLAFGALTALVAVKFKTLDPEDIIKIRNDVKGIFYKSPVTIEVQVVRRGHPGNIIRCDQTGEVFASQNRAAELLNISKRNLSKHLRGENESVSGFTFTNLGEAR